MKKILFCGGSHMGQSKKIIEKKFDNFDLEFYITAGPKNRDWSINGGRYKVDGTIIGGNGHSPSIYLDLSKYTHIVFVGQYIQIWKFFTNKNKMNISKSLLQILFKNCFTNLPFNHYNEPLDLFPKIAYGKLILIPDPLINFHKTENINLKYIDYFYKQLSSFCDSRSIQLCMPTKSLLDDEGRFVKAEYMRARDKNDFHCLDEYWQILFDNFNYF